MVYTFIYENLVISPPQSITSLLPSGSCMIFFFRAMKYFIISSASVEIIASRTANQNILCTTTIEVVVSCISNQNILDHHRGCRFSLSPIKISCAPPPSKLSFPARPIKISCAPPPDILSLPS